MTATTATGRDVSPCPTKGQLMSAGWTLWAPNSYELNVLVNSL